MFLRVLMASSVGFETAANLAEEDEGSEETSIPRAVLGALFVSVFYQILSYVEVAGFGFDLAITARRRLAGAPLFALGAPGPTYWLEFWLSVSLLVVFLDTVYVGVARGSTARGVFAMARDRRLPRASVSSSYGTPVGGSCS